MQMASINIFYHGRYVESFFISLTTIEQELQQNLVSFSSNHSLITKLQNTTVFR